MNEFQTGLLAIGTLVVLVVIAFNKWQERRYRRQSVASIKPQSVDVLLEPLADVPDSTAESETAREHDVFPINRHPHLHQTPHQFLLTCLSVLIRSPEYLYQTSMQVCLKMAWPAA